jgi:hypothetical protein
MRTRTIAKRLQGTRDQGRGRNEMNTDYLKICNELNDELVKVKKELQAFREYWEAEMAWNHSRSDKDMWEYDKKKVILMKTIGYNPYLEKMKRVREANNVS